jgi:hypothetical protein
MWKHVGAMMNSNNFKNLRCDRLYCDRVKGAKKATNSVNQSQISNYMSEIKKSEFPTELQPLHFHKRTVVYKIFTLILKWRVNLRESKLELLLSVCLSVRPSVRPSASHPSIHLSIYPCLRPRGHCDRPLLHTGRVLKPVTSKVVLLIIYRNKKSCKEYKYQQHSTVTP